VAERPAVLEPTVKPELRGMRAAHDEVMTLAAERHHPPERIVGELLAARLADVGGRAKACRLGKAKLPVMRALGELGFAASPANATLVRGLRKGAFLAEGRNVVLIGGTGSGETHPAIAVGASREREARSFNTVDLVNQLGAEARAGEAGRPATRLPRADLVIPDELGCPPFPRAGGQVLSYLTSRPYERASVIVTTNLPSAERPSMLGDARTTTAPLDRPARHRDILEAGDASRRLRARARGPAAAHGRDGVGLGAGFTHEIARVDRLAYEINFGRKKGCSFERRL
jgi:DNA replication protein DnaC